MSTAEDRHPLDFYPDEETGDERADSLMLIDKARAALALAETLPDIGAVRDVADRAAKYARAAKLGRDAENHAIKLRLDAETKAGGLLIEMDRQGLGRPEKKSDDPTFSPPRLADLGISKQQSSDWQAMARLPKDVFDEHVQAIVTKRRSLTTAGVVEVARKLERQARIAALPPAVLTHPDIRIEVADALAMPLDDESVDMIVTSPPYGLDVEYADGGDVPADQWRAFTVRWLREAYRVLKPHGRLAVNIPLDTSTPYGRPTYAQVVVAATDLVGFEYAATIDWHENNGSKAGWALGSQASARRPHHVSRTETIAILSKGPMGPSSSNPDDITPDEFDQAGKGPWTFSGESRPWEDHPAAYPLELPRRLIPYLCRVGDVVLDPFCGSGTTLLAAIERGRRAIGSDISPTYVESAKRRIVAAIAAGSSSEHET